MSSLDAQLAQSRRDGTHAFKAGDDREICAICGRRRWAHVEDGHHWHASPPPTEAQLAFEHKSSFRAHPGWTKPGSTSRKDYK